MKSNLRVALAFLATGLCLFADPAPMNLWPGDAPGEKGDIGPEQDLNTPKDGLIAGRPIIRLGNVSVPTLTLFRAPAEKATGTAILVVPGGGYHILAYDLEGTEVCSWLNSVGVTAVLLKYRVPKREGRAPYAAALEDAQRAMGLARLNAKAWGFDPHRLGILGFSAGGNLTALLSAKGDARSYARVDATDDEPCVPDFQLLIYPAYLVKDNAPDSGQVNPEVAPTEKTPPTFLVMAQDDPVHVENVLAYALALQRAKVPLELHVYPTGHHGYGLRSTKDYVTSWPARAADWMRSRGLLGSE